MTDNYDQHLHERLKRSKKTIMADEGLNAIVANGLKKLGDGLQALAAATASQEPEAAASINGRFYDPNGVNIQITARNGNMSELVENWGKLSDALLARGYRPQGGPSPQQPPEPPPEEVEAELNPQMARAASGQQAVAGNGLTFEAEKLAANSNEGKVYWKIKGGQFRKYGVTIWPEVLQAAIQTGVLWDIEGDLDSDQVYLLDGITACYEVNDRGKPSKVTQLIRTQITTPPTLSGRGGLR